MLAAGAAKVAVDAGAPRGLLTTAIVAALGIVALMAARRWTGWSPSGRIDGPRAVLLGLAVLLIPTVYGEVGGDGIQAFVVVRSAVVDQDLDLANDYVGLGARPAATETGQATSHLPIGLALLWLPPFLVAHVATALVSVFADGVSANGFGAVYRSAVTMATYLYGVGGLVILEAEVRRRHDRALALLVVLAIWLATPLHFYMTANPAMAHGASVFAATAFVVAWLRARAQEDATAASPRTWAVVGLLGGLMTLVRLQDVVLLALPVADLLLRRPDGWPRRVLAFSSAAAALGVVQLAVWLRLYGSGFLGTVLAVNLVGGTSPQVVDLLLSARHGLFTWTPLYLVCVLGWMAWARNERWLALMALAAFTASVILNASIQDWWGSEAFGQRRLLGLTPLFALGLAEALAVLRRRPMVVLTAAVAVLAAWTISFEGIYNSGVVARRDEAIGLERLAQAQVDSAWRRLLALHGRIPERLWVLAYDNLKGIWIDEGPRSLGGRVDLGAEPEDFPVLVGRGWYDPEVEDGVTLRRSRGRGSWLRVPLRERADYDAVVRLRPEVTDIPIQVTFEVNTQAAGTADVRPGWSEYVFAIPASLVRPGLNDIAFAYSTTPRVAQPEYAGRNAAVAVDWVTLRRR